MMWKKVISMLLIAAMLAMPIGIASIAAISSMLITFFHIIKFPPFVSTKLFL